MPLGFFDQTVDFGRARVPVVGFENSPFFLPIAKDRMIFPWRCYRWDRGHHDGSRPRRFNGAAGSAATRRWSPRARGLQYLSATARSRKDEPTGGSDGHVARRRAGTGKGRPGDLHGRSADRRGRADRRLPPPVPDRRRQVDHIDGSPQGKTAFLGEPHFMVPEGRPEDYRGHVAIEEGTVRSAVERAENSSPTGWVLERGMMFGSHTDAEAMAAP